mmetsp:Transcript_20496/g.34966  ORF Transcript_20496/g.34966 Transcript_20496/m.34966 type:complete len:259 (-) Transcript_20496:552-1328(-)
MLLPLCSRPNVSVRYSLSRRRRPRTTRHTMTMTHTHRTRQQHMPPATATNSVRLSPMRKSLALSLLDGDDAVAVAVVAADVALRSLVVAAPGVVVAVRFLNVSIKSPLFTTTNAMVQSASSGVAVNLSNCNLDSLSGSMFWNTPGTRTSKLGCACCVALGAKSTNSTSNVPREKSAFVNCMRLPIGVEAALCTSTCNEAPAASVTALNTVRAVIELTGTYGNSNVSPLDTTSVSAARRPVYDHLNAYAISLGVVSLFT